MKKSNKKNEDNFTLNPFSNRLFQLIFCSIAIIYFSQFAFAQSGRRTIQPKPTPNVELKTKNNSDENDLSEKIESLILVGETQENAIYSKSNYVDAGLKECLNYLKIFSKLNIEAESGGKMNLKEAKEMAVKETNAFVLWIGYVIKADSYGRGNVAYLEYIILKPQTGKKLTFGQITPEGMARKRRISGFPDSLKRSTELSQIKEFSRELMGVLIQGGWLTN